MTIQPNTLAEKHALLDARNSGKKIRIFRLNTEVDCGLKDSETWNFDDFRYDIVPGPWRGSVIVDKDGNAYSPALGLDWWNTNFRHFAPFRPINVVEEVP